MKFHSPQKKKYYLKIDHLNELFKECDSYTISRRDEDEVDTKQVKKLQTAKNNLKATYK